ncbi:MAG: CbtB domain-containing protein [Egibacteraceae bacterium]
MTAARLSGRELAVPALGALVFALLMLYAIGFDQGVLVSPVTHAMADRGGVLHEFFHDARHLLGIPCH